MSALSVPQEYKVEFVVARKWRDFFYYFKKYAEKMNSPTLSSFAEFCIFSVEHLERSGELKFFRGPQLKQNPLSKEEMQKIEGISTLFWQKP